MTKLTTIVLNIGVVLAVIGCAFFILDVGIGQTANVIMADDAEVTAATYTALGKNASDPTVSINAVDRVTVAAAYLTLLTTVGGFAASRRDPAALKIILNYFPLVGMAIGITEFGSQVSDMISGDYAWDTYAPGLQALHMAVTGWVAMGVARLLRSR